MILEYNVTKKKLDRTIFHPQGGGQPSDTGKIVQGDTVFVVKSIKSADLIEHLGEFENGSHFEKEKPVTLKVDPQREIYAKLHSAGHILGS